MRRRRGRGRGREKRKRKKNKKKKKKKKKNSTKKKKNKKQNKKMKNNIQKVEAFKLDSKTHRRKFPATLPIRLAYFDSRLAMCAFCFPTIPYTIVFGGLNFRTMCTYHSYFCAEVTGVARTPRGTSLILQLGSGMLSERTTSLGKFSGLSLENACCA